MSIVAAAVTRVFSFGGRQYPDPNAAMTPEEVKTFYSAVHPELLNAQVEGGDFEGDTQVFTFARSIGTKG